MKKGKPVKFPNPKLIPRAVPNSPTRDNPLIASLGRLALATLGYEPLYDETTTGTTTLDRVLHSLEIEILDEDAVTNYMKERLTALNSTVEELTEEDEAEAEEEADDEVDEDEDDDEEEVPRQRGRYRWNTLSIQQYEKPIPEFVLAKAIQIKHALPKVSLTVEYVRFDKDPFLVATFGGQKRYVEVWNEPKFEGRLTKEDAKKLHLA